ncbi:MAG: DUF2721 domain-containing protein [Gammaproteobacteria bacterium]|nr:DUF2721 domain-containing protein [Gammaproteobacteria bacterium]NNJ50758.1 DUF2721 domain-containing protein [Gammaproteobacteria bacterium]
MQIDVTTPALLFPAISLLLLAYTNRFMGITKLIRQLRHKLNEKNYTQVNRQVANLKYRIKLIIWTQATGVVSLILCTLSMMSQFFEADMFGYICFALSLILMVISLILSLLEIAISGKALNVELEGMEKQNLT